MADWKKDEQPMRALSVKELQEWIEMHSISDESGVYVRLANGTRVPLLGVSCVQTLHSTGQEVEVIELLHCPGL